MAKQTTKKPADSKPQSKRGGARPGAGAKPKAVREFRDNLIAGLIQPPPTESNPGVSTPLASSPSPRIVGGSAAERAIKTIEQIMDDTDVPKAIRLQAAREILDRVVGKPRQAVEVTGQDGGAQVVVYIPDNGRDPAEEPRT